MRYKLFSVLLVFLAACSAGCPDGYLLSEVDGEPACISQVSYCEQDSDCFPVRLDCSTCDFDAVNVNYSQSAIERSKDCSTACSKRKRFYEASCVKSQCEAKTVEIREVLPPASLELVDGKSEVCYVEELIREENFTSVYVSVLNDASTPVYNITSTVTGQKELVPLFGGLPNAFMDVALLEDPLLPGKSRLLNYTYETRRLGYPKNFTMTALRGAVYNNLSLGFVQEDELAFTHVPECVVNPGSAT